MYVPGFDKKPGPVNCEMCLQNLHISCEAKTPEHMCRSQTLLVLAILLCGGVAWCAGDDAGAGNSAAHAAQGSSVHHRQ